MKILILLSFVFLFVACSSNSYKEIQEKQAFMNQHMAQGKVYQGTFDSKFNSSGNDGVNLRSIGIAVYPIDSNEILVKSAAIADAKFKLTEAAPTEMKRMVQKAIGNSLGYVGEFNQIETSVSEVHALRGIETKAEDVQCLNYTEPVSDGTFRMNKECRALAKVSNAELTKAFDFTVERKYGIKEESVIKKILNQQLESSINPGRTTASQESKQ